MEPHGHQLLALSSGLTDTVKIALYFLKFQYLSLGKAVSVLGHVQSASVIGRSCLLLDKLLAESAQVAKGETGVRRPASHVGPVSFHFLLRITPLAVENSPPCQAVVHQLEPHSALFGSI